MLEREDRSRRVAAAAKVLPSLVVEQGKVATISRPLLVLEH